MAHTFQKYGGRMVLVSEYALIYGIAHLWHHAVEAATCETDKRDAAEQLRHWLLQASEPSPLRFPFDAVLNRNPVEESRFMKLIESAESGLSEFENAVPASYWRSFLRVDGLLLSDVKVAGIKDLYDKLRSLVIGEGPELVDEQSNGG